MREQFPCINKVRGRLKCATGCVLKGSGVQMALEAQWSVNGTRNAEQTKASKGM